MVTGGVYDVDTAGNVFVVVLWYLFLELGSHDSREAKHASACICAVDDRRE